MKREINILKKAISIFWNLLAGISTIFSLCIAFIPWNEYENKFRLAVGIGFAIGLVVLFGICFLAYFLYQKYIRHITLKIDGSEVTIRTGNIFDFDSSYLKVIGFNSDFDTHVGDGIIDPSSLNGVYLNKFYSNDKDLKQLNLRIKNDVHLQKRINRLLLPNSNKNKYKLGTIFRDKDFLLLSLTNFDENNNARVTLNELADCFLTMWSEIDEFKGSSSIVIPLLGSGRTTRIGKKGAELNVSNQELLELLLATFKISRIKIKKPANITILLQEYTLHSNDSNEKIDLLKLKEIY